MNHTETKSLTQPADWWAAWQLAANANNQTLAAWIGEQCNKTLPKTVAKQLSERKTAGRPRKSTD